MGSQVKEIGESEDERAGLSLFFYRVAGWIVQRNAGCGERQRGSDNGIELEAEMEMVDDVGVCEAIDTELKKRSPPHVPASRVSAKGWEGEKMEARAIAIVGVPLFGASWEERKERRKTKTTSRERERGREGFVPRLFRRDVPLSLQIGGVPKSRIARTRLEGPGHDRRMNTISTKKRTRNTVEEGEGK